ncbi:urease accessory protein UreF [Paenibacillus filicis]|uniref:Urease accessory protein UreF n=1 Tax=Paenibacillus filicis TaxID=669464 RepID=A0ABU9DLB6_9BACL
MNADFQQSWLAYTQFLDSALPIGGFSHSFGLETLVQEGIVQTPSELKLYLETMLRFNWSTLDALAVKAVYVYAPAGEWERLWQVDRMQHVQRSAAETREGVAKMGRRLHKLACSMYPELSWEPLTQAMNDRRCIGTHPLLHGWVVWQLGVPLTAAAEGYLYQCVLTGVNSGLRLMSLGQTEGQRLIASLLPAIRHAWSLAEALDPLEDGMSSTPQADLAMMRHETLYSRLFMS